MRVMAAGSVVGKGILYLWQQIVFQKLINLIPFLVHDPVDTEVQIGLVHLEIAYAWNGSAPSLSIAI